MVGKREIRDDNFNDYFIIKFLTFQRQCRDILRILSQGVTYKPGNRQRTRRLGEDECSWYTFNVRCLRDIPGGGGGGVSCGQVERKNHGRGWNPKVSHYSGVGKPLKLSEIQWE